MKLVMFSSTDIRGGAARACYRLKKSLELRNLRPALLVKEKFSRDRMVFPVDLSVDLDASQIPCWKQQSREIDANRSDLSDTWFSLPCPGYDLSSCAAVAAADVINIHWVAQFQSVATVAKLLNLGKPVVWTLHDEHPYTGGCHYTAGCEKFRTGCQDCPQLRDDRLALPGRVLAEKSRLWKNPPIIVTPSHWLGNRASGSRVFSDCQVRVIPNGLETGVFRPLEKRQAKRSLKIPDTATVVMFNAEHHGEKRKGLRYLIEALRLCRENPALKSMVRNNYLRLVTVGDSRRADVDLGLPVKRYGFINSDRDLARIYSAADIFVQPSLEDNLPNTVLEAQACGTPVVGFDIGGMPDMINDEENGLLSPEIDAGELARRIEMLALDPGLRRRMGESGRKRVERSHTLEKQADAYIRLFREILAGNAVSDSPWPPAALASKKIHLDPSCLDLADFLRADTGAPSPRSTPAADSKSFRRTPARPPRPAFGERTARWVKRWTRTWRRSRPGNWIVRVMAAVWRVSKQCFAGRKRRK